MSPGDSAFYWDTVFPTLWGGVLASVRLVVPSGLAGLAIGTLAAYFMAYGSTFLSRAFTAYVSAFRGTPLVVQLVLVYFGLPNLGLALTPFGASIVCFSLCSGAYHAEYIHGGISAIKKGQLDAARALGFTGLQVALQIVIPQAFRRALPGIGNELIYLIKYSSLASLVSMDELAGRAFGIVETYHDVNVYYVLAGYYLFLVSLASIFLELTRRRLAIPGLTDRKQST